MSILRETDTAPATLEALTRLVASGAPVAVEVHGLTPMIYVAYLVLDGHRRKPLTQGGATIHFRSRSAAQTALAGTGLSSATFVHQSSYGEMIGVAGSSSDTEL